MSLVSRDTSELTQLETAYVRAACGLLTTAADGTIVRVNETFCAWAGRSAETLVGQRFQSLLTIGSKLFHQTHWAPLLQMQGSVAEVQLELANRDGSAIPVLVNAVRRMADDGEQQLVEIAVFVAADRRKYERELLLARRRAEELLERAVEAESAHAVAEARLRLALESANLRVWRADPATGLRQYDPSVALLLGHTDAREVSAEAYASHMHPEDRTRDEEALREAFDEAKRGTYCLEYPLLGVDGVKRVVCSMGRAFFDGDGRAVHFSGVIEDITDRRRAEEALQQGERKFRTLAENSPDLIVRFAPNRRIVYMSPAVERITGRPVEDWLGRKLEELDPTSALVSSWSVAVEQAFSGSEVTSASTHTLADGARRELQTHLVPEKSARGEVVSVLGIARDITLLRERELEAEQRATFAEQLVGIVSHDLRNPLNAISLAAHLLSATELGEHVRVVRRIISSTERATRLTADLLDFTQARLGGGLRVARSDVDIHAVVADALEEVRMAWAGRMIEHKRQGHECAWVDPHRMAQIVSNLVGNALVYGAASEPVTVTSVVNELCVEIRVHNGGAPIPAELQLRIFEPLRRGEQEVQLGSRSVGLGLYIVREIAAAHGGQVTLRSCAEEGTTFSVSVPRTAAQSAP